MREGQNLFDLSKIVFVTNSLSGHRLTWFLNIYNLQIGRKRPIELIFVGESSNLDYDDLIFRVYPARSGNHMIQIARSIFNEQGSLKFIFLDGEQWLKHLIRVQLPSRVLIMRPFISTFNVISFLRFVVKKITLFCLRLNKNIEIGFLKIPHHSPSLRKSRWISDNLTASDINIEEISKKIDSNRILILFLILQV